MYICSNCGNESLKWQGKCNFCGEWNTLQEFKEEKIGNGKLKGEKKNLTKLDEVEVSTNSEKIITKSSELNNALGGGITKGSVILLSGEPGIGKSTITLELANLVDEKIIYVSGEETSFQIASRAKRLGISGKNIEILSESCIEDVLETISHNKADILVIDSISVMHSKNISGVAGSISQVKFISEILVTFAKTTNTTVFIIGHITKDGNLAGPKTLEHMVDTVLYFEGDKYDNLRILRTLKNRFGATSEIGIFSMTESGLKDLKNPELEFVSSKEAQIGSSLSITIEGSRPIIIETESLTTYTKFGYPKRSARGINSSKLDLIVAVLGKYSQVKLDSYDVYSNIARGLKIEEPGIDLSIAVSIISSKLNKKIDKESIFLGEISLTGKIKKPIYLEKRLKEAEKIGIKKVFLPDCELKSKKCELIKLKNIEDLIKNI
ncbi:DNA repair protein RadA [Candidatus Gracilibacteria bacterium]|nr:DNA repair protein RadA [Candidatus Gracilibacteria bacterium]RKW21816.1 MAG: DNA repair protein RadA [Candidatus Gracilibacteria bacterium]